MDEYESLSHGEWECKYHVVFIPKCRRKSLYGGMRRHLAEVFRKLAASAAWLFVGSMSPFRGPDVVGARA